MTRAAIFPDNRFAAYFDSRVVQNAQSCNPHYHLGYELLYFIDGERLIRIGDREYRARAGDLAIFRPGVAHEEELRPGFYRLICLRFPKEKVALPFPDEHELKPVLRLPFREKFRNVLEQIVVERKHEDSWSEKMVGACLLQFTILLWRALSAYRENLPGNRDRISHVIGLIHEQIDSDVHLKDLAERAFMSESHFSRTFKEVAGVPPKRFLINAKIAKARDLLAGTAQSVVAISGTLGFQTPQYFNRLFRKKCGCTPLQYRRKSGKVQSR